MLSPWQSAQQQQHSVIRCRAAQQEQQQERTEAQPPALVGEDAAVFDPSQQSLQSWALFAALLTGVSALLYPVGGHRPGGCCPFGRELAAFAACLLPSRSLLGRSLKPAGLPGRRRCGSPPAWASATTLSPPSPPCLRWVLPPAASPVLPQLAPMWQRSAQLAHAGTAAAASALCGGVVLRLPAPERWMRMGRAQRCGWQCALIGPPALLCSNPVRRTPRLSCWPSSLCLPSLTAGLPSCDPTVGMLG